MLTSLTVWLVLAQLSPTTSPDVVQNAACEYGTWSTPRTLEERQHVLRVARFPDLVVAPTGEGVVVGSAGWEAFKARGQVPPNAWPPTLKVIGTTAPTRELVLAGHWFAYPRIAIESNGVLHVVWAGTNASPPSSPPSEEPLLTDLYYARFARGKWTAIRHLYRGLNVRFERSESSGLLLDSLGGLHLAFTATDSLGPAVVTLHRASARSEEWRASYVRVTGAPVYADMAVLQRHELALVFVAPPTGGGTNALFLSYSVDQGRSWSTPESLRSTNESAVYEPRVLPSRNGAAHIIWREALTGTFGGSLGHLMWTPNRTPARAVNLPLGGALNRIDAAVDGCDAIHVVAEKYDTTGVSAIYTRFDASGWASPRRLFEGIPATQMAIAASSNSIFLVWNTPPLNRAGAAVPQSALMEASLPIVLRAHRGRGR